MCGDRRRALCRVGNARLQVLIMITADCGRANGLRLSGQIYDVIFGLFFPPSPAMYPETAFGPFLILPALGLLSLVALSGVLSMIVKKREDLSDIVTWLFLGGGVLSVMLGVYKFSTDYGGAWSSIIFVGSASTSEMHVGSFFGARSSLGKNLSEQNDAAKLDGACAFRQTGRNYTAQSLCYSVYGVSFGCDSNLSSCTPATNSYLLCVYTGPVVFTYKFVCSQTNCPLQALRAGYREQTRKSRLHRAVFCDRLRPRSQQGSRYHGSFLHH